MLRAAESNHAKAEEFLKAAERAARGDRQSSPGKRDAGGAGEGKGCCQGRRDAGAAARPPRRRRKAKMDAAAARRRRGQGRRGGTGRLLSRRQTRPTRKDVARVRVHQPQDAAALYSGRVISPCSKARSRSAMPTSRSAHTSITALELPQQVPTCAGAWCRCTRYADRRRAAQREARRADARDTEAAPADVAGAKAALDRIAIPRDALDRISEVVLPGSSLIISDEGASIETGKDTDFVVLMSGEAARRASRPGAVSPATATTISSAARRWRFSLVLELTLRAAEGARSVDDRDDPLLHEAVTDFAGLNSVGSSCHLRTHAFQLDALTSTPVDHHAGCAPIGD